MEITVVKEFTFDSAHFLPGYNGKCAVLHGHTYRLRVGFCGEPSQFEDSMVLDFTDIKKLVQPVIDQLDHTCLNTIPEFPYIPTAEKMVGWICKEIINQMDSRMKFYLSFVRLWETPTSYAEWRA